MPCFVECLLLIAVVAVVAGTIVGVGVVAIGFVCDVRVLCLVVLYIRWVIVAGAVDAMDDRSGEDAVTDDEEQ